MDRTLHPSHQLSLLPATTTPPPDAAAALWASGRDKIRLYGIDAPEKSQECKDAQGQPYACGKASTDALAQKVGKNQLRCEVRRQQLTDWLDGLVPGLQASRGSKGMFQQ